MGRIFRLDLNELDLCQLLDGLEVRAEAWDRTANFLRTETMPEGEFFIIEECSHSVEAENIAAQYRSIISKIPKQMEARS